MVRDGDRDRSADAPRSALPSLHPPLVPDRERRPGDAGGDEGYALDDEQERATAGTNQGEETVKDCRRR